MSDLGVFFILKFSPSPRSFQQDVHHRSGHTLREDIPSSISRPSSGRPGTEVHVSTFEPSAINAKFNQAVPPPIPIPSSAQTVDSGFSSAASSSPPPVPPKPSELQRSGRLLQHPLYRRDAASSLKTGVGGSNGGDPNRSAAVKRKRPGTKKGARRGPYKVKAQKLGAAASIAAAAARPRPRVRGGPKPKMERPGRDNSSDVERAYNRKAFPDEAHGAAATAALPPSLPPKPSGLMMDSGESDSESDDGIVILQGKAAHHAPGGGNSAVYNDPEVIVIDSSSDSAGGSENESVEVGGGSATQSLLPVAGPGARGVCEPVTEPLWRKNAATIPTKLARTAEMLKRVTASLCEPHQVATNPVIEVGRCVLVTLRGKKEPSAAVIRGVYFTGKGSCSFGHVFFFGKGGASCTSKGQHCTAGHAHAWHCCSTVRQVVYTPVTHKC